VGVLKPAFATLLLALAAGVPAVVQAQFDDEPIAGAVYGRDTETAEEGEDGGDEPKAPPKQRVIDLEKMRKGFRLRAEEPSAIPAFVAPKLPDLTPYTVKNLEAKIDRRVKGRAVLGSMLGETAFRTLTSTAADGFRVFSKRQSGGLRAIYVEAGYVTLADLAKSLPKDVFEQTEAGVYTARLPLVVRHGATLHIDRSVSQLRLSQDRGVVLAVEGDLFVTGATVLGWNEAAKGPAWFRDKHEFRPFIVSWGGSRTFLGDARIAHLGFASTKAYGFSLTQYGVAMVERTVWAPPTGWIIDSEIEDLWYGFYSYEADDVVMRGNKMKNNIKYGFDPHDRSRRLIIAENEAWGTRHKHGIIISREVQDSWIIGNKTHDNGLAGIMLDRQCKRNVIANNIAYKNGSDGIVISESPDNLVWNNLASNNLHHGIRVRNSTDIRLQDNVTNANGLTGVYGNTLKLDFLPRDLKLDPYSMVTTMTVVGGQASGNGAGPLGLDDPTMARYHNLDLRVAQRELGYRFSGMFVAFQIEMLDVMLNQKKVAVIERSPSPPSVAR
jgi:poly(beta-D-mannuronate) C5 epimerase